MQFRIIVEKQNRQTWSSQYSAPPKLSVVWYWPYAILCSGRYFPAISKTSWSEHSRTHITLTLTNDNFCHSKHACQRTEYRLSTINTPLYRLLRSQHGCKVFAITVYACVRVQVYSSLCHLNLQSRNSIPIPVARRRSICIEFRSFVPKELDMNLTSLKVGIHRHCSINKLN